jgi:hypothetical protein
MSDQANRNSNKGDKNKDNNNMGKNDTRDLYGISGSIAGTNTSNKHKDPTALGAGNLDKGNVHEIRKHHDSKMTHDYTSTSHNVKEHVNLNMDKGKDVANDGARRTKENNESFNKTNDKRHRGSDKITDEEAVNMIGMLKNPYDVNSSLNREPNQLDTFNTNDQRANSVADKVAGMGNNEASSTKLASQTNQKVMGNDEETISGATKKQTGMDKGLTSDLARGLDYYGASRDTKSWNMNQGLDNAASMGKDHSRSDVQDKVKASNDADIKIRDQGLSGSDNKSAGLDKNITSSVGDKLSSKAGIQDKTSFAGKDFSSRQM